MLPFFKKSRTEPAKAEAKMPPAELPDLHIGEIPGVVENVDGFPRVKWSLVREAVKPYAEHRALDQIWTELAAQWLGIVRRHIGEDYEIFESQHLLLLSRQGSAEAWRFLEVGDAAYERLQLLLDRKSEARELGKHVVLMMGKSTIYYDYISHFYAESDEAYGQSGGVHISRGYRHTVINGNRGNGLRTLVHELAHDLVFDRPLPRWLNEGLAQFSEDIVPGYRPALVDARQVRVQQRYWSWFGMDHFWQGRGFVKGSAQRASYKLADVLFRNLATHRLRGRKLGMFLASADRRDAGVSACKECFGCSLSTLVEEFLGPGDWEPKQPTSPGSEAPGR